MSKVAGLMLAAGKGTRMGSSLPKVLHEVGGKPMLSWALECVQQAAVSPVCLVLGGDLAAFSAIIAQYSPTVCVQNQRRGTGDAVAAAACGFQGVEVPSFADGSLFQGEPIAAEYVLVCYGDVPGIASGTLKEFTEQCLARGARLGVIGMRHPTPFGYGRLVTNEKDEVLQIVEERDATAAQREIQLCNTGIIFAKTDWLFSLVNELRPDNAQGEYYLTDCFALSHQRGKPAYVYATDDWQGFNGVNTPEQRQAVEEVMRSRGLLT